MSNLLSLNTDLEDGADDHDYRRDDGEQEVFNMDWLESLEFKEEQHDAEEGCPEKETERKRKHNQGIIKPARSAGFSRIKKIPYQAPPTQLRPRKCTFKKKRNFGTQISMLGFLFFWKN